jgi:sortase A
MLRQQKFVPYRYTKQVGDAKVISSKPRSRIRRLAPTILITLGSLLLANVAWPIISYQLAVAPGLQKQQLVSPLVRTAPTQTGSTQSDDIRALAAPELTDIELDFSNPKNWFPQADYATTPQENVYYVHIPKLDIRSAQVIVGGEDLNEALIQYPGTALPGQAGSPVIFGHSVLRAFYNPKFSNPHRYVSIFSKIMTLEKGDEILVDYDGISYTYEVRDKIEVKPEDISILEQRFNNRELKLITCVPEGTYLRRGVVIAQLVDLN